MALIEQKAKVQRNKTLTHAVISVPYNTQVIDAIKAIPGWKWHNEKKLWTVPIDQIEAARVAIRPYFQIEGEESQVEWKTVKLHITFEQNKRHAYRKCVLIDGCDLLNVDHGNLINYASDFDILENEGGFTSGDERAYYWAVEYHLTVKMRKNGVIEAVRGTCEVEE